MLILTFSTYSYFNTLPQKPNFCTYIFLELFCVKQNQILPSIRLVWFWILTEYCVIRNHPSFGVKIRLKQLKFVGALCSLCKVTGDLGFLNYMTIYLLGTNKTYSPLYNIYQFSTKLIRQAG